MTTNEAKLLKKGTEVTYKKKFYYFRGMTEDNKSMKLSETKTGKIKIENARPASVAFVQSAGTIANGTSSSGTCC